MAGPSSLPSQPVAPEHKPYVPASTTLPETTVKAIILGALLSVVLASANVYLGLFAGLTVSASIPAAVISMGVLRLFRERNILENNIVQTATSAGESLAAGVIFTIPALVILGTWDSFVADGHYWQVLAIAGLAGTLGVMFTIPLRRAFIVDAKLLFPEGVACAEVLEVGEQGGGGVKIIALGGLVGGLFKFFVTGVQFWRGSADVAFRVRDYLQGFGANLSPALLGVGYIIGFRIAAVIFMGGVISWFIGIPVYTMLEGVPETFDFGAGPVPTDGHLYDYGLVIWSTQIRYLGVGAMAVGGVYALLKLMRPLVDGIRGGIAAYRHIEEMGEDTRIRTERDMNLKRVTWVALALAVPLTVILGLLVGSWWIAVLLGVLMLVAGFMFSSVAGYMAGVVGSSNNPISGVMIATSLVAGAVLWLTGIADSLGILGTVGVAAIIACAAAIAGDNLQDLKTGYILGATPFKQQSAQILGVLAAAFAIPFILELIQSSFGICPADESLRTADCLSAPQASLLGSVAGAFFGGSLPWVMVGIGAAVAVAIILMDEILAAQGSTFRMPVLAVAVGIYLPIELTSTIFIGGLLHLFVTRRHYRLHGPSYLQHATASKGIRDGVLFASGLIAGEAIIGILMGIPRLPAFAARGDNAIALMDPVSFPFSGVLVFGFVVYLAYYIATRDYHIAEDEA